MKHGAVKELKKIDKLLVPFTTPLKPQTKVEKENDKRDAEQTQKNPTSAMRDGRGIYPKSNKPQQHQKHGAMQTQLFNQSFSAPTLLPVILLLSLKLASVAAILLL